jgi:hypothetical protein
MANTYCEKAKSMVEYYSGTPAGYDPYEFDEIAFIKRLNNSEDSTVLRDLIIKLYGNHDNDINDSVISHMGFLINGNGSEDTKLYCKRFQLILTILILLDQIHDVHESGRDCDTSDIYSHCFNKAVLFDLLRKKIYEYGLGTDTLSENNIDAFKSFIFNNILKNGRELNSKEIGKTLIPDKFYVLEDGEISGKYRDTIRDKAPVKVNSIGTFMDPHSCSDRNIWNERIDYFSVINIALLYYQSYFKYLKYDVYAPNGSVSGQRLVVIYVGKNIAKEKIPCNGYQLCFKIINVSDNQLICKKCFIIKNRKTFSVNSICEALTDALSSDITSSELFEFFTEDCSIPHEIAGLLIVTIFTLAKGFGDFGQGFESFALSLYDNVTANSYWCNTFTTTVDTFFFLISELCMFPTIIGTAGGNWDLIITFENKLYLNASVIDSHNNKSDIQIIGHHIIPSADISTLLTDSTLLADIININGFMLTIRRYDIDAITKAYFKERKAYTQYFLKNFLFIYPVQVSVGDESGKKPSWVYLLINRYFGRHDYMFCDTIFLEDMDPSEKYPESISDPENKATFEELRYKAGHLDITTVGELYAMGLFLCETKNIKYFADVVTQADNYVISGDAADNQRQAQARQPLQIYSINMNKIRIYLSDFRLAVYELARDLLITAYNKRKNIKKLDHFIDEYAVNYLNKAPRGATSIIEICMRFIKSCTFIPLYKHTLDKINTLYKYLEFCVSIFETILQNIKKINEIKDKLLKIKDKLLKIKDKLEVSGGNSDDIRTKIELLDKSISFLDNLSRKYLEFYNKYHEHYVTIFNKINVLYNHINTISPNDLNPETVSQAAISKRNNNNDYCMLECQNICEPDEPPNKKPKTKESFSENFFSRTVNTRQTSVAGPSGKGKGKKGGHPASGGSKMIGGNDAQMNRDLKFIYNINIKIKKKFDNNQEHIAFLRLAIKYVSKFMKKFDFNCRIVDNWYKDFKVATKDLINVCDNIILYKDNITKLQKRLQGINGDYFPEHRGDVISRAKSSELAIADVDKKNEELQKKTGNYPFNNDCNACETNNNEDSFYCDNSNYDSNIKAFNSQEYIKARLEDPILMPDVEEARVYDIRDDMLQKVVPVQYSFMRPESAAYQAAPQAAQAEPQAEQQYIDEQVSNAKNYLRTHFLSEGARQAAAQRVSELYPAEYQAAQQYMEGQNSVDDPEIDKAIEQNLLDDLQLNEAKLSDTSDVDITAMQDSSYTPEEYERLVQAEQEGLAMSSTLPKGGSSRLFGGRKKILYNKHMPKTAPVSKPKTAPASKPKTAPASKPKITPVSKPKTAPTTKPKTAPASKPKTVPASKPKTAPASKPKITPTTKPKTAKESKPKTAPASKPKTAPTAKPKTAPASKPKTTKESKPKTAPASKPKTAPTAKPKTAPASKPKTTKATKPKTAPASKPKTAPVSKPKTAPASKPKTAPVSKPKTAPASKPKKAPTTKPKTAPASKPKKAPTTKPKTAPTTKPKTAPVSKTKTEPKKQKK